MKLTLAAALLLLLGSTTPAAAVQCRASKGGPDYWQWRLVDGKRCWYPSRRMLPKSALHWSAPVRRIEMRRPRRGPSPLPAMTPLPPVKYGSPPIRAETEPEPLTFAQRMEPADTTAIVPQRVRTVLVGGPEVKPLPVKTAQTPGLGELGFLMLLAMMAAFGLWLLPFRLWFRRLRG